jgi:hypothetical protein
MPSTAFNAASIGLSIVPRILTSKDGTDLCFGLQNVYFSVENLFFGVNYVCVLLLAKLLQYIASNKYSSETKYN